MSNLLPYHTDAVVIGSGDTADSLISTSDQSQAYQDAPLVGTGDTANALAGSTFQALIAMNETVELEEAIDMADSVQTDPVPIAEAAGAADEMAFSYVVPIDEAIDLADTVDAEQSAIQAIPEAAGAADEMVFAMTLYMDEPIDGADSVFVSYSVNMEEAVDGADSMEFEFVLEQDNTLKVELSRLLEDDDTLQIQGASVEISPITDYDSASNPAEPTITAGGSYIKQNPSTDLGLPMTTTVVINDSGLVTGFSCVVVTFNLSITDDGGTWYAETTTPIGAGGAAVTFMGFLSTITHTGFKGNGLFTTRGTIGHNKLDLPLQQFAQETSQLKGVAVDQYLQEPSSDQWTTAVTLAQYIATQAGISLIWQCADVPVQDLLPESGTTARQAIVNLAERVGGKFVFGGVNRYYVLYPNRSLGTWVIPDCRLVLNDSPQQEDAFFLPSNQSLVWPGEEINPENEITPVSGGNAIFPPKAPKIEGKGSVTKLLEEGEQRLVPLDADYDIVYAQIITSEDASGQYVTLDSTGDTWTQWGGQIIVKKDRTRWARVTRADMPTSNTDVTDGKFQMNIGHTRKTANEEQEFVRGQKEAESRRNTVLKEQQEARRYVQSRTGSIGTVFFGSIPLPRMTVSIVLNGKLFQGEIDSVTVTHPGVVNISYSKWKLLNYYQNRSQIRVDNADVG